MNNVHIYNILINIEKMRDDLCKIYDYFSLTLDLKDSIVLYNTIVDYSENVAIDMNINYPTVFPVSCYVKEVIIGVNNGIELVEKLECVLKLQDKYIKEQLNLMSDIANMKIKDIIEDYYNIDKKFLKEFESFLNTFNIILGKPQENSLFYDTISCSYKITQSIIEEVKKSPEKYALAVLYME